VPKLKLLFASETTPLLLHGRLMPEPLPISALQHLIFCERQCALIHIEGLWAENRLTVEGRILHRKAHAEDVGPRGGGRVEARPGVRIVRGLDLESTALGLVGKADVVEFRQAPQTKKGSAGAVFPVEYKRGKPKKHDADRVQLCAQAMCLEEMLGISVRSGALYYGVTRRREPVEFDEGLRAKTAAAARRLHEMVAAGVTPRVERQKKCDRCSLLHLCLPSGTQPGKSALRYVATALSGE